MVTSRSHDGMAEASPRSIVVLPIAVPPVTRTLRLARTSAVRKVSSARSMVPFSRSWARVTLAKRWRRIETDGRAVTAMTADTRSPPGSWKFTIGRAAVEPAFLHPGAGRQVADELDQLGVRADDRRQTLAAAVGVLDEDAVAVDVDVLDVVSASSGSRPARPKTSSSTCLISRCSTSGVTSIPPAAVLRSSARAWASAASVRIASAKRRRCCASIGGRPAASSLRMR